MVPSQLSAVERGTQKEIRSDTLRRLAYHLGVTADWIIGPYEEEPKTEDETVSAAV